MSSNRDTGISKSYIEMGMLMVLLMSFLCLSLAMADSGVETTSNGESEKLAPLIKEIEKLRAQVGSLDSDLERKEAHIGVIEKELKVLKAAPKDNGAAKPQALSKLETELESQAIKLKELEDSLVAATKQSEQAHQYAEALKKRAELAEQSVRDLEVKVENTQKKLLESKKKALQAEKSLKAAEGTISEAEKKLRAHGEELSRVHGQWLPPWAASQISVLKTRVQTKWYSHAKPHVDSLYKHASDQAAAAHAYVKPQLDTVTSKVYPEAQKHWKTISDSVAPHVELLLTKTRNGYDVVTKDYLGKVRGFVNPHVNSMVDASRPYFAVVRQHTRPYVDQLATISKPYLDHGQKFVKGHLKNISPYYRGVVSAAIKHHENLQETVKNKMSKHEVSAVLMSKELVWFLASALLALPVFTAFLIFASVFGGAKTKEQPRRTSPRESSASSISGTKHKRAKKVDK